MIKKDKSFAFDFDGVIAQYDGVFRGQHHETLPNEEVVKAIKTLRKKGYKIIVHSTRSKGFLKKYCKKNKIQVDYFNENPNYNTGNKGKPVASVYLDDRSICYKGQKAKELVEEIETFKPYYKK